jgi:hypothetical protein
MERSSTVAAIAETMPRSAKAGNSQNEVMFQISGRMKEG